MRTPVYVRLFIVAAFAIFIAACAVLFYSYIATPETNCNIVINANRNLEGAKVTVDSASRNTPIVHLDVTLAAENGYSARFFLASGTYRVRLVKSDGLLIINDDPFVPPGRLCTYDIARLFPENPATAPALAPVKLPRAFSDGAD